MRKELFKIQTSSDLKTHLIYNEDRSYFGEIKFDDILFSMFEFKGFARGYVNDQGKLVVQKKINVENWPAW